MRKVLVKEIRELTEAETDCLLSNYDVQREIIEFANESESYWLDEIFYCISGSLSDYSISESFNSYIRVKDYQSFYTGIMQMHEWYDVFSGTDIIERLDKAYELYYGNGDDDSEFIKQIKLLEVSIASVLGGYANWYTSYDELEYETDYILSWLEGRYDTECIVDGGSVTLLRY